MFNIFKRKNEQPAQPVKRIIPIPRPYGQFGFGDALRRTFGQPIHPSEAEVRAQLAAKQQNDQTNDKGNTTP